MPRPQKRRFVYHQPEIRFFKPDRIPLRDLTIIDISNDEIEAMRLVDGETSKQETAAKQMGISQPTLSKLLAKARKKVISSIVQGKALRIVDQHPVLIEDKRTFICYDCDHRWNLTFGEGHPQNCPKCMSKEIFRIVK